MIKKLAIGACVLGFLALSTGSALATSIQPPVWSGNGANVGSSWTSQTGAGNGFVSFDTFSFASATSINQLTWDGIFLNLDLTDGVPNTSRWDVLIFDSDGPGGSPQSLIGGQLNANAVRTAVGTGLFINNPVTVYQLVATFPDFTAAAGHNYWVAPVSVGVAGNFAPFFSWIEGTGGDGQAFQAQLNNFVTTDTFVRPGDRAFALASVPEPSTLALLAIGLGGAAARRRRRS